MDWAVVIEYECGNGLGLSLAIVMALPLVLRLGCAGS